MSEIKQILKLIEQKKELDSNLSIFSTLVATKYAELGMINLATSLYLDCEDLLLGSFEQSNRYELDVADLQRVINTIKDIIDTCIIEGDVSLFEDSMRQLDKLRIEISENVKLLNTYSDTFTIYEKVIKYRMSNANENDTTLSDEEYATQIVNHIFADQDQMLVNIRIQEVLKKLPIRLSRIKFFSQIEQVFSVYKDGSKSQLQYFIDLIENYALIARPTGYGEVFSDLYLGLEEFRNYLNHPEQEVIDNTFIDKFEQTSLRVEYLADSYVQAMKIVNDLYSVLLTLPYVIEDSKIIDTCKLIISKVSEQLANGDMDDKSIESLFQHFEDKQEQLNEAVVSISDKLDDVVKSNRKEIEDLFLNDIYNALLKTQVFYTNSLFMNIMNREEDSIVNSEQIVEIQKTLIKKLSDCFSNQTQELNRAIMAEILGELPIFFHSVQEVADYVLNSLKGCGNANEKKVRVLDILNE